jgi:hypothetical protein
VRVVGFFCVKYGFYANKTYLCNPNQKNMKTYGRIFQDENFVVQGFDGQKLAQLIGVEDADQPERGPILVYIKTENSTWQRFFLDVCFAVWENWDEVEDEDEAYRHVDYAAKFGVQNLLIQRIYCENNEITLVFEPNTKLILKYVDATIFDGEVVMVRE